MLRQIVTRLFGQVRLRVEASFPERILNLCGARNLSFWDLDWESSTAFTCRISRQDYRTLRQAVRNLDCELTVLNQEGVPFFLGRFRRRHALLIGLAICSAALFFGSFFIWDFTVEGNENIPEERILRALQKNGVSLGTFGFSFDAENIRNHVLLEIPELSWITVNVSGCRAYVQVRERILPPETVDERKPTNVIARRDGFIQRVQALDGVTCAMPGSSVTKGQILIAGIEDTKTFGSRILAGMGTVDARTWYTLQTEMPLQILEKQYTGEECSVSSLIIGTQRVKFFGNSSIWEGNYDKITERHSWALFGLPLPIVSVKETYRFYEPVFSTVTPEEAKQRGEKILTDYLHTLVDDYGEIQSTLCTSSTSKKSEGNLQVTLSAECLEQIGETVPIYTESTENKAS